MEQSILSKEEANLHLLRSLRLASMTAQDTEGHTPEMSGEHSCGQSSANDPSDFLNFDTLGLDDSNMDNANGCNESVGSVVDTSSSTQHFRVVCSQDSGFIYHCPGENMSEHVQGQEQDGMAPYAPWRSKEEWELAYWLSTSQLSQREIDNFLKLKWVSRDL